MLLKYRHRPGGGKAGVYGLESSSFSPSSSECPNQFEDEDENDDEEDQIQSATLRA